MVSSSSAPVDPLGAGNTALIAALGVTPLGFWDVRKNLTSAAGAVSSLADVSGAGTYGPALVQATGAKQPAWDGTTINFDGVSQYLLSATTVTGLDLSTPLTSVLIADVQSTTNARIAAVIGAAAAGAPNWRVPGVVTGPLLNTTGDKSNSKTSTTAPGTGEILAIFCRINVHAGTAVVEIEVPPAAIGSSGSGSGAEASGNQLAALGALTSGVSPCALRFRAWLAWAGGYTAGQRDTVKTWAQTYHGAVVA